MAAAKAQWKPLKLSPILAKQRVKPTNPDLGVLAEFRVTLKDPKCLVDALLSLRHVISFNPPKKPSEF